MSQAQAAAAVDRLPWLEDEPKPAPPRPKKERGSYREIAGWAVSAILLVAGISYWLGVHSWQTAGTTKVTQTSTAVPEVQRRAVVQPVQQKLPEAASEPQSAAVPAPVREQAAARRHPARRYSERRHVVRARHEHRSAIVRKVVIAEKAPPPAQANLQSKALVLWPSTQSEGARGRIVRIGAFGSRQQAKLGWRYMVRAYPAVAHLPATVVESRNSRGRPFYRFQIGTTSQAHSEVLCQRMGRIRFSCAVVGLPFRPKGVER